MDFFFFSAVETAVLHGPWLVEPEGTEGPTISYTPINPLQFKGQLSSERRTDLSQLVGLPKLMELYT